MVQVRNRRVWNQIRILFMGSAVLFLINIYFGFDNTFTTGILPRAQALIHSARWVDRMDHPVVDRPSYLDLHRRARGVGRLR